VIFRLFLRFGREKSRGASRTLFFSFAGGECYASHVASLESMECPCSMGKFCSPLRQESGLYRCFWKELNTERNLLYIVCFDFTAQAQFCVMDVFCIKTFFLVYS